MLSMAPYSGPMILCRIKLGEQPNPFFTVMIHNSSLRITLCCFEINQYIYIYIYLYIYIPAPGRQVGHVGRLSEFQLDSGFGSHLLRVWAQLLGPAVLQSAIYSEPWGNFSEC